MKHLHYGKPVNRARHVDVRITNHGSLYLLNPQTDAARDWLSNNVSDDANWFGDMLPVEPRYMPDLLAGMRGNGLVVQ